MKVARERRARRMTRRRFRGRRRRGLGMWISVNSVRLPGVTDSPSLLQFPLAILLSVISEPSKRQPPMHPPTCLSNPLLVIHRNNTTPNNKVNHNHSAVSFKFLSCQSLPNLLNTHKIKLLDFIVPRLRCSLWTELYIVHVNQYPGRPSRSRQCRGLPSRPCMSTSHRSVHRYEANLLTKKLLHPLRVR
jgi:hypothetical protein